MYKRIAVRWMEITSERRSRMLMEWGRKRAKECLLHLSKKKGLFVFIFFSFALRSKSENAQWNVILLKWQMCWLCSSGRKCSTCIRYRWLNDLYAFKCIFRFRVCRKIVWEDVRIGTSYSTKQNNDNNNDWNGEKKRWQNKEINKYFANITVIVSQSQHTFTRVSSLCIYIVIFRLWQNKQ